MTAMAVFSFTSIAQHISDFDIRHFNSENGLPQNSIKAIAPDEYGFIWLASEAGLLRYDGRNFRVYNKKNTGTLNSRMIDIRKSPVDGHLIAISESKKLLQIKQGKATVSKHSFYSVFFPHWDQTGNAGHPFFYLSFFKQQQIDSLVLPVGNNLTAILTLNSVLWYKGLSLISYMPIKRIKSFSSVFVMGNALFLSHDQLTTDILEKVEMGKISKVRIKGDFLNRVKDKKSTRYFFETNNLTNTVYLFSGQYLYEVSRLPDGNINTKLILHGFDLADHQIYKVYYDSIQARLFLGSKTEGLYVLSRKKFFTARYSNKNPFVNVLYSLTPLNDSTILTGTGTVFFTRKDARPEERRSLLEKFENLGYVLFRSSKKNTLWFCYNNNVYELDQDARNVIGKWSVYNPSAVSEDRDGNIWIGTVKSGLYRIDSCDRLSRVLNTTDHINCIEWETDTSCWIGTEGHLFHFFPKSRKIDTITTLNNKIVRSIYIPRPGEIWICSYENGLYLLKEGKLTSFPIDGYPALQTVHKILEDKNGFFWISTNNGLYQVSRPDLLRHHHDPTFRPYYFRYGSENGFLTNEFNGSGPDAATKIPNGFFAFASMNGAVFFKPESTIPELPTGKIIIDHIVVDEQEINTEQPQIILKRNFERISITPVTAYFGNYTNLKYEFNLNNNVHWQTLTGENIIFSTLPSGHNYLTIRKRSGFGKSSYVYCTLDIYVIPAWWEHTWFYLILLVLLFLLFWMTVWFRTRYWKQRSQRFEEGVQNRTLELNDMILELERSEEKLSDQLHFQRMLNENITHDVNAPLKYLTIYTGEVLKQSIDNKPPDPGTIEHIHNATRNIHALAENLTGFLKTKYKQPTLASINVRNLVEQKLELFSIGAKRKNVLLKNETDPTLFINQNETLLGILLHNLIDNALKNTGKGSVLITSRREKDGKVSLQISDTGRGLSEEQVQKYNTMFNSTVTDKSGVPTGFGFIIVKEIAKILHVSIHMESVLNEGTEITIIIAE
jgi:signal transduction histidine kinase